jgi:hypothetical protein
LCCLLAIQLFASGRAGCYVTARPCLAFTAQQLAASCSSEFSSAFSRVQLH